LPCSAAPFIGTSEPPPNPERNLAAIHESGVLKDVPRPRDVTTVAVHVGQTGQGLLDGLRAALPDVTVIEAGSPEADAEADVLATLADGPEAIAPALTSRVRWIHVLGAGIDGFPLDLVGDRVLTSSRGAAAPAIAEFVLAAMLAFEKQIPESWIDDPPARWNSASLGGLAGRTLGVVGLGAIGTEVARRALAFDMHVVGIRRTASPAPLPLVALSPDLPSLLRVSEHVVVAAPATARTNRLFDDDTFQHIKPGAPFVNVARGSLVAHERVRLSPHISWSSPDTIMRTFEMFTDNLARYRAGRALHGVVNLEEGY
jgi:phosphoglycerate dehydrogenase-like enzyme